MGPYEGKLKALGLFRFGTEDLLLRPSFLGSHTIFRILASVV